MIGIQGEALDRFLATAAEAVEASGTQTMLTPGIQEAYERGVASLASSDKAREVARGQGSEAPNQCRTGLFVAKADDFLADEALQQEIFGATSLVVTCSDQDEVKRVAEHLEGQLTATLQMDDADLAFARELLPTLERRAGRVMVNGWPTGVEVCHAMVHGGLIRPRPTRAPPQWAARRSIASCVRCAIRTCPRRCCPKPCVTAILTASAG